MRKFLIIMSLMLCTMMSCQATKIPDEVSDYILHRIPKADIRFDGVITLPSNTIYLPLFPSLFSDIKKLSIKESVPKNVDITSEPDLIIFNNDFVLMKVLSDGEGHRTVLHQTLPPLQVRTGLLPQDMLVPSGLIIPENIKGIIGNLKIDTKNEDLIKVENKDSFEDFLSEAEPIDQQALITQLKNKVVYIATNYSKNIQVLDPAKANPNYSLAQKSIPIDVKPVNDAKFLLVTTYDRPFIDVISVADTRFIKQISVTSNPEEILVDNQGKKAYIASPSASTIFVVDIPTMSLVQKIKVNGYCEKLLLEDGKLFYVDKLKNEIWAIELDNAYILKDIGCFPNVSDLAFHDNKLYIVSRTKSRIAVVDYKTLGLITEFTASNKPIKALREKDILYVLGAQDNVVQKIDIKSGKILENIKVSQDGFSSKFNRIDDTNLAVITDIKNNTYSIFDLSKGRVLKNYKVNVPIKDVIITNRVRIYD